MLGSMACVNVDCSSWLQLRLFFRLPLTQTQRPSVNYHLILK